MVDRKKSLFRLKYKVKKIFENFTDHYGFVCIVFTGRTSRVPINLSTLVASFVVSHRCSLGAVIWEQHMEVTTNATLIPVVVMSEAYFGLRKPRTMS